MATAYRKKLCFKHVSRKEAKVGSTCRSSHSPLIVHTDIAYLRGFRAYRRPEDVHEGDDQLCNMWRTYLEYAPHGDLDRLKNFYKVYYRYLPEAFLWHVFHSLAVAARALGPDDDLGSELENIGPDRLRFGQGHILHMDFKPKNILLGYQEPHVPKRTHGGLQTEGRVEDVPDYPMIKLSDFGVASWVTEGVYFHKSYGTPSYQPPVRIFMLHMLHH